MTYYLIYYVFDYDSSIGISTKFAGSSCNDLVTIDGVQILSGHFDKKIRFWDQRSESSHNEILLQGKVTSLDLSRDRNFLLACVRDDSLVTIDLRMNQKICNTFTWVPPLLLLSIQNRLKKIISFRSSGPWLLAGSMPSRTWWYGSRSIVPSLIYWSLTVLAACISSRRPLCVFPFGFLLVLVTVTI